ncbi:MAG: CHAP domain-containing protein [Syntrophorhabdaceae bacterium]|nr:CHAP domain-containing protein [Syntrophorhabdaceae bacterium]
MNTGNNLIKTYGAVKGKGPLCLFLSANLTPVGLTGRAVKLGVSMWSRQTAPSIVHSTLNMKVQQETLGGKTSPSSSPAIPSFGAVLRRSVLTITLIIGCFMMTGTGEASDIVSIARSEIGHGETWGNNRGSDVRKYLGGRDGLPWCAGFVSYCAKKSGLYLPYTLRAKDYLRIGKITSNPQSGDLIVFSRNGGGHIGIIEKVNKDKITTIEGNVGNYPARVKRITYTRSHIKNLLAFVRIGGTK